MILKLIPTKTGKSIKVWEKCRVCNIHAIKLSERLFPKQRSPEYKMEAVEKCQDVFVTKGGTKDDEVIGWITNVIITKSSKV